MVKLKRAYEPASRSDGYRVLVERLWPRGVGKQALPLDRWDWEIAPSPELRKWFAHDPAKWSELKQRYRHELKDRAVAERLHELAARAAHGTVTLVFSSHDPEHHNAVVLKEELTAAASRSRRARSPAWPGTGDSASRYEQRREDIISVEDGCAST